MDSTDTTPAPTAPATTHAPSTPTSATPATPSAAPATTPAPAPSTTTTPTAPAKGTPSVADAGKAFLASLDTSEGAEDGAPRDITTATWNDVAQRWQKPDGTFVANADVDELDADAAEETPATTTAVDAHPADERADGGDTEDDPSDEPTAEPVRVVLPGDVQRGESDLEIEVDDPDLAERLAALKNDGLRRNEFHRRMQGVETRETQLRALELEIAQNPTGFMLDRIAPARRLDVARALVLEHFDELAPDIAKYWENDGERKLALADVRGKSIDARRDTDAAMTAERNAQQVITAVRQLIPDDASPEDADEFYRDAVLHLQDVSRAEQRMLTPADVPGLLAKRLTRYGFATSGAAASPEATAPKPVPRIAVVRPQGDDAKALAERAKATQQRMKQHATRRTNAAAVTPPGAGAMPVERPKPPKGADVKAASQWIRNEIRNGSWAPPAS